MHMRKNLWVLAFLILPVLAQAQHQSVVFSTEKNQLNGGLPLPRKALSM